MNISKIYKTFLMSQTAISSVTKLSKILKNQFSHDRFTKFLNSANINSYNLWNSVSSIINFKSILNKSGKNFLIIDDTIIPKEYRKQTKQVCWHYDHAKGRCIKGIQIITCFLNNILLKLPIDFRIIEKTEKYKDKKTGKIKTKSKITKNELFREILNNIMKKIGSKISYILADSWYCSNDNIKFINNKLQKKFIFAIKSNRLIKLGGTQDKAYECINKADIEPDRAYQVELKGISIPLILIKKVFTNGDSGKLCVGYYISNDLGLTSESLYNFYQKRWKVEEYHRFIKQNVSIGSSPCRTERAVSNHIGLSLMAYVDYIKLSNSTNKSIHSLKYEILIKSNFAAFDQLRLLQNSAA